MRWRVAHAITSRISTVRTRSLPPSGSRSMRTRAPHDRCPRRTHRRRRRSSASRRAGTAAGERLEAFFARRGWNVRDESASNRALAHAVAAIRRLFNPEFIERERDPPGRVRWAAERAAQPERALGPPARARPPRRGNVHVGGGARRRLHSRAAARHRAAVARVAEPLALLANAPPAAAVSSRSLGRPLPRHSTFAPVAPTAR